MRKKLIFIFISLLLATMILAIIIYYYPKQQSLTFEGVMFQLGEDNSDHVKQVTININGKVQRNIVGIKTFKGFIDIEGETIPVPEQQRELELRLGKYGEAIIVYTYIVNGVPNTYSYGGIFVNNNFSKIAIWKNDSNGYWDGNNGFMISAPANNRTEALGIANELMEKYLKGYPLK